MRHDTGTPRIRHHIPNEKCHAAAETVLQMGYWIYYLAFIALGWLLQHPVLLLGIVLFYLLRTFLKKLLAVIGDWIVNLAHSNYFSG